MPARRIALLLPGQGSQHVGMGRDLASARREAAEVFERANDVLGVDLRRICWEGPETELTRTENAQPAILVHSYAAWSCLPEELRRAVSVGAGHSLGEFSAYLMAGALGFDDALRLVRRRGELMARAGTVRPGTMAALIGLVEGGRLTARSAKDLLPELLVRGGDPEALMLERGLEAVSDAGLIEGLVDEVIANNPDGVASVRAGDDKPLNFLMGQVMRATQGKASPAEVRQALVAKIRGA